MIPPSPTLLQALRRFWTIVAAGLVLGGLAAAVATLVLPPTSVAVAKLGLDDPRGSNVFRNANLAPTDLIAYAQGQANFASSQSVLEAASALLPDRPSLDDLQASIAVAVNPKSPTLEISATSADPATAVARANAVADAYKEVSGKGTAASAATALETIASSRKVIVDALPPRVGADSPQGRSASTSLSALDERAGEIRLAASLFNDGVSYTVRAAPSGVTRNGNVLRNLVAGVMLGGFAGCALALVLASKRRPAEDADELCEALGSPLIGVLTPRRGVLAAQDVELVTAGFALRSATVLAFVGVSGARGVGDLVAEVARTYASWGHTVGLVLPAEETLDGATIVEDSPVTLLEGAGRVDIVAISDPRSAEQYVDQLAQRCQVVLVAAPDIERPGTANLLLAAAGAVLVVRQGSSWTTVHRAHQVVGRTTATMAGVLFLRGPVQTTQLAVRQAVRSPNGVVADRDRPLSTALARGTSGASAQ